MQSLGWIDGKNVLIFYRTVGFKSERLPAIVAELVALKVNVSVTAEAAFAAKRGTDTIPIVAVDPADAVAIGLMANLARPGGNVIGLSYLGTELAGKQIELLKERFQPCPGSPSSQIRPIPLTWCDYRSEACWW